MSYGIQVFDASGREVIGPDTFTVRLIDVVYMPAGQHRAEVRVPCAKARRGMFAAGTFSAPKTSGNPGFMSNYDSWSQSVPLMTTPRMSGYRVEDGYVAVFPPSGNARFDGGQHIYVFARV